MALACALESPPVQAQDQTRVVCIGEQTTHSAHRENDPEYPLLMGPVLDADFVADNDAHPDSGGFLYGGGTNFRIANLGVPKGSVLNAETGDAKPVIGRNELNLAEQFDPDVVVLGPFGSHEALTNRSMDNFTDDFVLLIERIEGFTSQPEVLIALPLPHGADNGGSNGPIYQRVKDESTAVAADRGMQTIDLWTPFINQGQYYQDATHLTESGRQMLADVVGAALIQWADDRATIGSGGASNGGMSGTAGASGGGAGVAVGGAGGLDNGTSGTSNGGSAGEPTFSGGAGAGGATAIPAGGTAGTAGAFTAEGEPVSDPSPDVPSSPTPTTQPATPPVANTTNTVGAPVASNMPTVADDAGAQSGCAVVTPVSSRGGVVYALGLGMLLCVVGCRRRRTRAATLQRSER